MSPGLHQLIIVTLAVAAFVLMACSLTALWLRRRQRLIHRRFSDYLSPGLVEALARSPERLSLGGETRDVSILVCDVQVFQSAGAGLEPHQLAAAQNALLTALTEIVMSNGGTIDKYVGTGLIAFWNAPLDVPHHAERCCRTALSIVAALPDINERLRQDIPGIPSIEVGIGINTGNCTVGNVGSPQRFDYTVIGDPATVAFHLHSAAVAYRLPICIGAETANQTTMLAALPIDRIAFGERRQPVEVLALLGDETVTRQPEFAMRHRAHRELADLMQAGDWGRAEIQLAALAESAPVSLRGVYANYAGRIVRRDRLPSRLEADHVAGAAK